MSGRRNRLAAAIADIGGRQSAIAERLSRPTFQDVTAETLRLHAMVRSAESLPAPRPGIAARIAKWLGVARPPQQRGRRRVEAIIRIQDELVTKIGAPDAHE